MDVAFLAKVSRDVADALGISNEVMLECLMTIYSPGEDAYCNKITPLEFRVIRDLAAFVELVFLSESESDQVGDTASFVYHNLNTGKTVLWSHCWGFGRGLVSKEQLQ